MNRQEHDTVSLRWTLGYALVVALIAAVQRIAPHPFNMTMIGALGLWSGARLRSWQGLLLPLLVWAGTDLILWWMTGYPSFNPFVAGGFLLYGVLGLTMRNKVTPSRLGVVCVAGSLQFFLLTNFSVWLSSAIDVEQVPSGHAFVVESRGGPYPHPMVRYATNVEGLVACYVMGLPFHGEDAAGQAVPRPLGYLGNLLVGDLLFASLVFAMLPWLYRRFAAVPRYGETS